MSHFRTITLVAALVSLGACSDGDTDDATPTAPQPSTTVADSTPALSPSPTVADVEASLPELRVGLVAPSAVDDLAWTQSMVASLERVAEQRDVDLAITAGATFVDDAAAAIADYADQDLDLVIAHGTQYAAAVETVAAEHPDVSFAIGTTADFFGLDNVFAYTVEAAAGGYVNGVVAAQLTESGVMGVVGPVPVADAVRYVDGFVAGAESQSTGVTVLVNYIDSFSDEQLASEAAAAMVAEGADVLTGTAQMSVGAAAVAVAGGLPWMGTQVDQTELGPDVVVASAVYRWDGLVTDMLDALNDGVAGGQALAMGLADGGLTIEFNDQVGLAPAIRASADDVIARLEAGEIDLPVSD